MALSINEVKAYLPNTKVVCYSDLKNYRTIDDLLGQHQRAIILTRFTPYMGHFCLLHLTIDEYGRKTLEFFDPISRDEEMPDSQERSREIEGTGKEISRLMINSPYKELSVNEYPLQNYNTMVCGWWCIARALFYSFSLKRFNALLKQHEVNDDNIIPGYYNLRHLVLFAKCTNLCTSIEIYMKNNFPIVINFTVGSIGSLKLALAPKVELN